MKDNKVPVSELSLRNKAKKSTSISSRKTFKLAEIGEGELLVKDFDNLHIHHLDADRQEVFWCKVPEAAPIMSEPFYYQALRKYATRGYSMPFTQIGPGNALFPLAPLWSHQLAVVAPPYFRELQQKSVY